MDVVLSYQVFIVQYFPLLLWILYCAHFDTAVKVAWAAPASDKNTKAEFSNQSTHPLWDLFVSKQQGSGLAALRQRKKKNLHRKEMKHKTTI